MKNQFEDFKLTRSEQSRARIDDLIPPSPEVRTLCMQSPVELLFCSYYYCIVVLILCVFADMNSYAL